MCGQSWTPIVYNSLIFLLLLLLLVLLLRLRLRLLHRFQFDECMYTTSAESQKHDAYGSKARASFFFERKSLTHCLTILLFDDDGSVSMTTVFGLGDD